MQFLKKKTLMITGGTGSFGQMCTKFLLKHDVKKIIIYSRDELKQFEMFNKFNSPKLRFLLGDVVTVEIFDHFWDRVKFGYAAAEGVVLFILLNVLAISQFIFFRKRLNYD